MPNSYHVTAFAGLPVVDLPSEDTLRRDQHDPRVPRTPPAELAAATADPGSVAWRVRTARPGIFTRLGPSGFDELHYVPPTETVSAYLDRFFDQVPPAGTRALIVGDFPGPGTETLIGEVADVLLARAAELTGLHSLFFGEVVQSENEISWIDLCDLVPLIDALPRLRRLTVRGGSKTLGLAVTRHEHLEELTVQSGALRAGIVRQVCAADLPALRRLELWLGAEEYGGDTALADLAPVLSGTAFPRLEYLGVRNTEGLDDWIAVLADAPVTARVRELDLSLGTLTDVGAAALLEHADSFRHLDRLDLHHHYLSEEMRARVAEALPGVEVDLSDPQEPDFDEYEDEPEYFYYSAVSE